MNSQSKVQETPASPLPTIIPSSLEEQETYTVQLRLPHLNFNRLTVSVEDDEVVLDARADEEARVEARSYRQSIRLPEDVQPEPFYPRFELGMLNLTFNRKSWVPA